MGDDETPLLWHVQLFIPKVPVHGWRHISASSISSAGPAYEAQVTVIETYSPFTISPVMRVAVKAITPPQGAHPSINLPSYPVLKVYDRRFANELREYYKGQPPTYKSEALYRQYLAAGNVPKGLEAIESEIDTFKNCPSELFEHFIAAKIAPYFDTERSIYERLASLQGRGFPTFYASTEFLGSLSVPDLDPPVPGILLQHIPGVGLDVLNNALFNYHLLNLHVILPNAIRIVDICGDLDVLNRDVRLGNFIVEPDGSVFMIDFAQARLRGEGESDSEWKRAKRTEDEEGAVGCVAQGKFKTWRYVPTDKYAVPANECDEYPEQDI